MKNELWFSDAPLWLVKLFNLALEDFKNNKFNYDGSTFGKERYSNTLFEVASFIHDWLNYLGIVSYQVDTLLLRIMKQLNYSKKQRFARWFKTRFTFINIWRHKLKGTYRGKFAIELILER